MPHDKKVTGRKMVSIHAATNNLLELQLAKINKLRAKASKVELTRSELIALAIENVTIEMGVSK